MIQLNINMKNKAKVIYLTFLLIIFYYIIFGKLTINKFSTNLCLKIVTVIRI